MKTEDKERTGEGSGGIFPKRNWSWDQVGVQCYNQIGKLKNKNRACSVDEKVLWRINHDKNYEYRCLLSIYLLLSQPIPWFVLAKQTICTSKITDD